MMEDSLTKQLESTLQNKAHAEKQLVEVMHMEEQRALRWEIEQKVNQLNKQEVVYRRQLKDVAKQKKEAERDFEKLKELGRASTKPISTAMDEWIRNQGWLTSYTYIHVYLNKFEKGGLIKISQKMIKVTIKITLKIIA